MVTSSNRHVFVVSLAAVLAAISTGCEPGTKSAPTDRTASVVLPDDLFLTAAPPNARGVAELKADENATGEVVVYGRVGGRVQPFVQGAAVFLLADLGMKACDELHEGMCKTPWDYCCEPRESLRANTATIQIVGRDGRPLRVNLAGQHGLEPLREIIVTGTVERRDETGSLVINARGVYVKPEG